ncbi:MAG: response regulator [Bdellovibrio sp.]
MTEKTKILAIDDNAELGFIVKQILETDGYEVHFESDPKVALNLLDQDPNFAIILCDYNMPGMNGEQVIQYLRAHGHITPVVFLTGYPTKEFILSALRLGASDVLEKPCPIESLLKSIQRVLEIERRKGEVYAQLFSNPTDSSIKGKLKMLGLMHVANNKKTG